MVKSSYMSSLLGALTALALLFWPEQELKKTLLEMRTTLKRRFWRKRELPKLLDQKCSTQLVEWMSPSLKNKIKKKNKKEREIKCATVMAGDCSEAKKEEIDRRN